MGGVFLTEASTDKKTQKYQHGKIRVVRSATYEGWRKNMQDALLFHRLSKEVFLFAIFDGHGGVEVSQFCARHLVSVLEENDNYKQQRYKQALEEIFEALDKMLGSEEGDKELREISVAHGMKQFEEGKVADSVGCTSNVVLLVEKTVYVANAGDSRTALSRNGKILQLSFDHKPDDPLQKQRIIEAGCTVGGGRINNHLNLSRCLGDLHYKHNDKLPYDKQAVSGKPDVISVELCKDDDFIIMGCDGVWERYETEGQGLIEIIRKERLNGKPPEDVLEEMLDSFLGKDPTKEQLGCDNMSAILIEFNKNAF